MIQKTLWYLQPDFQKIEDVDTGISYWRLEVELDYEQTDEPKWLVVEAADLKDALIAFTNQITEHYR